MTLQQLETKGHVYLDDLRDVVLPASPTVGATVQITAESTVILSHRYYGDANSEVHLDLRDLVRDRTSFALPDPDYAYTLQDGSGIYITVTLDDDEEDACGFYCYGFAEGLRQRISRIDRLRVPRDFRLVVSLPNLANILSENSVDTDVRFISHVRSRALDGITISDGDGYILAREFLMSDLQPAPGVPFQLEFAFPDVSGSDQASLRTPVYEVCQGSFEQYLFLTDFGSLENIPMDGDLKAVPSYAFENASHPSGMVKVKDGMEEIFEQSSGYLTRAAADELVRLLRSSDIYHLEDGSWRRILIESPSVSLGKMDTLRSVTFTWRHVETD